MFRRNASMLAAVFLLAFWSGAAAADSAAALGSSDLQDANIGSGAQVNAIGWSDMGDVNAGGNQLTGGGANSNGGDRASRDLVLNLGGMPTVASAALGVEVKGNAISIEGANASMASTLNLSQGSGFSNSYGVTAVALNSGANASQSVSVNVVSSVSISRGVAASAAH